MQRVLSELAREGLVAFASGRGSLRVWHVTEAGAELAETSPDRVKERRKLLDAREAAGVLQAHTLAVNEVGIAFLRAARERGVELTPASWQPASANASAPGLSRSTRSPSTAHCRLLTSTWSHSIVPGTGSPGSPAQSIARASSECAAGAAVTLTANATAVGSVVARCRPSH
jgi:Replication-relaxation